MAKKAVNSSYRLHRGSGQAVVTLQGRTYYLGRYGSPESKEKFHRLVAESMVSATFGTKKNHVSVAEAVVKYLEYTKVYYPTGQEHHCNVVACKPMIELYASIKVADFGITELKVVRDWWVKRGSSRGYVNAMVKRIVRMSRWWSEEKIIDPSVHHALKCVSHLKRGRCDVREADPVKPVSDSDIEKTLPFLPQVVADMVRLQRLIGCRPGELVQIKPSMVDQSKDVWTITIDDHKNAWRGKERLIAVGPKAQAILRPYLERGLSQYCFSPKEAMEQRTKARTQARKTPPSCGNRPGTNLRARPRKDSEHYTTGTYGNAIRYACRRAKIEPWSPNQLRHAAATHLRKLEGIEAASVILGHSQLSTTEIYAEKNFQAAVSVAKRHG
jgi:integrase